MPKKADTTSAAQRHPETPPSPASVRASTLAGWLPPRPTRRPTGRLWRQGRRTPGRCALSDRVARQPRSTRRHLQLPASLPFAWHSNPRQAPLLPDPAQSGAQRNGHGLGPRPTGPRYGSGGHSHLVRRHAYLSCSMSSAEKKTPHHILWLWSHSRCAFVVQKCEGRARERHSRRRQSRPTTTTTNTIASSCLSDNEDFPYRRHQPGKLKRLSSD